MARRIARPLAARRRTGRPIYCGEFGSLDTIDRVDESIRPAWFADVISLFEEHDIPWAVWDYGKGGFGVLDKSGRPNRLVEIMTGRA